YLMPLSGHWWARLFPYTTLFRSAAKRKDRDDLVILDVKRGGEDRRIHVGLNGLQTPQWSPDGTQLVFTGFSNGFTDLFTINRDGDRKSTRLNSSHDQISYAVFCL